MPIEIYFFAKLTFPENYSEWEIVKEQVGTLITKNTYQFLESISGINIVRSQFTSDHLVILSDGSGEVFPFFQFYFSIADGVDKTKVIGDIRDTLNEDFDKIILGNRSKIPMEVKLSKYSDISMRVAGTSATSEHPQAKVRATSGTNSNSKIFIGHGHSPIWRELRDFLEKTLKRPYEEFNRIPQAGNITSIRLKEMLESCCMAFLIMTGEDEHTDGTLHARENVIHEIGLFQAQLGYEKAIILLEKGCEVFSNIQGITYIPFPKENIRAAFEDIREVLKREGILE